MKMSLESKSTTEQKPKLCIVEEQEIFRKLYESVLAPVYNIELLETNISEPVKNYITCKLNPEILLISLKHLDENTFKNISDIKTQNKDIGIILIVLSAGANQVELMRKLVSSNTAGLALFMKKSLDLTDQLLSIIQSVYRGQVIFDPIISAKLLSDKNECPFFNQMTQREHEILALLANGYTNHAIARTLYIDLKTVEHHINNMYGKLKSIIDLNEKHPRVEAARLYLEAVGELPKING